MADSGTFFVTERVIGKRLSEMMDNGDIDEEKADMIADAFLGIRDALEKARVVHRNVCPGNIIVCQDGNVKLTWFAFAVLKKSYRKEKKFIRRHFASLLSGLGGEYCFSPGKWSDARSLAAILLKLPRTDKTVSVVDELTRAGFLRVKAPMAEKCKALLRWIGISFQMLLRKRHRCNAKKRRLRAFCASVFGM